MWTGLTPAVHHGTDGNGNKALDFSAARKYGGGMKPKMGRPPKPKSEKQELRVSVNMTADEFRKLEHQAKAAGVSMAAVLLEAWRHAR